MLVIFFKQEKMTREQYIQIRKSNNKVLLAYNHYYEKCLEQSKNPMDFSIFNRWFPNYIGARHIVDSLIDYYDDLFNVVIIQKISVELSIIAEIDYL